MSAPESKKRKAQDGNEGTARLSLQDDNWLSLNVSGTRLLAKRETLVAVKGSALARMFDLDSPFGFKLDSEGSILMERDAEAFQWILGVLRRGGAYTPPPPNNLADRIRIEADFFGLDSIVQAIDVRNAREQPRLLHQSYETETVYGGDKYKEHLLRRGWSVKDIICTPIASKCDKGAMMRTVVLQEHSTVDECQKGGENEMHLYIDGRKVGYLPASFSASTTPFSLIAASLISVRVKPSGTENKKKEKDVAGKVAVAFRGGSSFADKARLAMDAGAVALIVEQWPGKPLEVMDAPTSEVAGINIPVLMVQEQSKSISGTVVDYGGVNPYR